MRKDVMRAMTAAASARSSVVGPRVVIWVSDLFCAEIRIRHNVPSNPALAHTAVETTLGLIPFSRASSGLSAEALTVLPSTVRPRNQLSTTAAIGTVARILIWAADTCRLSKGCQVPFHGTG